MFLPISWRPPPAKQLDSDVRPDDLLEGQLYSIYLADSEDELDDPFSETETLMNNFDV